MGEVTKAERQIRGQLVQVQRDLERLEGLAEGIFRTLSAESRDQWMEWWSSERSAFMRRLERGTPLRVGTGAESALRDDADLLTLEEVAAKSREEVAAIEGVGRVTMQRLDKALAKHNLSFAEAS